MSMYRICLIGALSLLGACSTTSEKAYSPPPLTSPVAPEPASASISVAPPNRATSTAAVPEAAPAPDPVPMTAPAARTAMPAPKPTPAPKSAATPKPMVTAVPPEATPAKTAVVEPAAVPTTARATISGHVNLSGSRGQQVVAGELADTLVYFVPSKGGARVKPGHFTVYTHNRDFSPEAIAVPKGSTVTFVNLDDVRHNVFSVTPGSSFNLGYQGSGEKASHAFGKAGVVLISCNVHRSMELDMLVVPTPFSTKVTADGSFTLQGLPEGPGKLYFWNPRAQPVSQQVVLPMSGAVSQKLLAIKPHMDTQLNTGATL